MESHPLKLLNQLKLANMVNTKSMLCTLWEHHLELKVHKTNYDDKNNKLKLNNLYSSVKLLDRKNPSFLRGVLLNIVITPSFFGGPAGPAT